MSKRKVEDIIGNLLPKKSKKWYDNAWQSYCNYTDNEEELFTEDSFIIYFDFLRTQKEYKSSTIWSTFSKLNECYRLKTGKKLQDSMPRLYLQLKSYNQGYQRKVAKVFTIEEIWTFLNKDLTAPKGFWLLRKAVTTIGFVCGLRMAEIRSLQFSSLKEDSEGIWVDFIGAKQRGEEESSRCLIPKNPTDPKRCFFTHLKAYLVHVKAELGDKAEGPLFKTCTKGGGYTSAPMGINYLYKIPKTTAEVLELPNPSEYTGHSYRRSSATQMANSGANSAQIRRYYRWNSDSTANKYLDNSRSNSIAVAKIIAGPEDPSQNNRPQIPLGNTNLTNSTGPPSIVYNIQVTGGSMMFNESNKS